MAALDEYIDAGFVVHDAVEMPPAVEPPTLHPVDAATLAAKHFTPLVEPVRGLIVEGLTLLCGASKGNIHRSSDSLPQSRTAIQGDPAEMSGYTLLPLSSVLVPPGQLPE